MLCRKNKPSKRGCFCSQSEKRCSASHGKSLEDVVGSIASKGCMTFIRQNTLDPPTCKLFDASLTCQFMLTFPLIAFLGAMMGFSCQRHVDEVQNQLSQISSIPWFTKVGHEPFNVGIYTLIEAGAHTACTFGLCGRHTRISSLSNSPRIRSAPQSRLSLAISLINAMV
jgi:hypothetical protein